MNIYQKYVSRFLFFFSSACIIFLLFIESNLGFKFVFNFANHFFLQLKTEEISGNWRDFTLKKIDWDIFNMSIKANRVHVVIDIKSLFDISTIFKKIETKNVIILFKDTRENILKKKHFFIHFKKNFFFYHPIILKKIHSDKILLKTKQGSICLFNIFSGVKFIRNNIILLPTHIEFINIIPLDVFSKKIIPKNQKIIQKNMFNIETIHYFLSFFSNKPKIYIPFNMNLMFIKCHKINFIHHDYQDFFQIELKADLTNNIFKIEKIKLHSNNVNLESYGKIMLDNNKSTIFFIKNKILIKGLNKKRLHVDFKGVLNEKFIFNLECSDLFTMNLHGSVLLNNFDHPFYMNFNTHNFLVPIKNHFLLNFKSITGTFQGKKNNYYIFLNNILKVTGLPFISINITGTGNLNNILLKKINVFPVTEKKMIQKKYNVKNQLKSYQDTLEMMGKLDIFSDSYNKKKNFFIPNLNMHGNIMQKKLSILGSLYYRDFNYLDIPGIDFRFGENTFSLYGSLSNKLDMHASFCADNLNYFLPNLKGNFKGKSKLYGFYFSPILSSHITAKNLNWNHIFLKKIDFLTKINFSDNFSGSLIANIEKIFFSNFFINSLSLKSYWKHQEQKIFLSIKNDELCIKFILNGKIDYKKGIWTGEFDNTNIKNSFLEFSSEINNLENDFKKIYHVHKKNIFSKVFIESKAFLFNIFHKKIIGFKKKLSFDARLKLILKDHFSDIKFFFTADNITLEKKIQDKVFVEHIDYVKLTTKLKKNDFYTTWKLKILNNSLEKNNIFGHLNIFDIYNTRNIKSLFILSDFPLSIINFFCDVSKKISGTIDGQIKFLNTLYHPKMSSSITLKNISITSNNFLKYIHLFFHSSLNKLKNFKIDQKIIIKKSRLLFNLDIFFTKKNNNIQWNLYFDSPSIIFYIFPKIRLQLCSELKLHYHLCSYDLIGYIKSNFFYFKINKKHFFI